MAVDDIARMKPMATASFQNRPAARAARLTTAAVRMSCAAPTPKIARRISQSRDGRTSRQDNDAELARLGDVLDLAGEPQGEGADDDAGDQIAQHRAEADALGQRRDDRGDREIDEDLAEHPADHTVAPTLASQAA